MPTDTAILDFDEPKARQLAVNMIRAARGPHRFKLSKVKRARSLKANAYMWGVVYPTVQAGIEEAWGESITLDEVHLLMKKRFLSRPLVDRNTGEQVDEIIGSTSSSDTDQFSEYLNNVIKFCGEQFGVEVPTPDGAIV